MSNLWCGIATLDSLRSTAATASGVLTVSIEQLNECAEEVKAGIATLQQQLARATSDRDKMRVHLKAKNRKLTNVRIDARRHKAQLNMMYAEQIGQWERELIDIRDQGTRREGMEEARQIATKVSRLAGLHIERRMNEATQPTEKPKCKTCGGKGWIGASPVHKAYGHWPCPACTAKKPDEENSDV